MSRRHRRVERHQAPVGFLSVVVAGRHQGIHSGRGVPGEGHFPGQNEERSMPTSPEERFNRRKKTPQK
ncbi:hypothetical protein C8R44DRAFT_822184 [Mycena epipterygia]|nr:hypothetical protein C8R44DRAFT_822184 [Mycena epipterygia]